jgi:hypothetical protein
MKTEKRSAKYQFLSIAQGTLRSYLKCPHVTRNVMAKACLGVAQENSTGDPQVVTAI